MLTPDVASVIVQSPNFFGQIEDAKALGELVHAAKAQYILSFNPISLAIMATPKECGADIAVGEGQPLGLPMAWGGPYLGIMTATSRMMRKLPGRIVGETTDDAGNRAFVLSIFGHRVFRILIFGHRAFGSLAFALLVFGLHISGILLRACLRRCLFARRGRGLFIRSDVGVQHCNCH